MLKKLIVLPLLLLSMSTFSQIGIKGGFAFAQTIVKNSGGAFFPGFDLGATYNFTEQLRAELLLEGFFHSQTILNTKFTDRMMPLTVGIDYSFLDGKIKPYAGLNLGWYNYGFTSRFGDIKSKGSDNYFGMYPKVGVNIGITDNLLFDLAAKFHMYFGDGTGSNSMGKAFGMNVGLIYLLK